MALVVGVIFYGAALAIATEAGTIAKTGPRTDSPKPVKIFTISNSAAVETRSYPGYLKARHDVQLSFRVSGPLVELPALKGKVVAKDELLARLDPRDYASNLASLDADVENAKEILQALTIARPEDIVRAEAAVESARATAANDKINLARYQNLYSQGVIPKSDLDQAQANSDVSESALEEAVQNLQKAKTGAREEDIKAAQAVVDSLEAKRKAARDALRDTELRAPFAGVVSERYVENHQYVIAKEGILSMQDLDTFEVVINIPEQLLILNPKGSILGKTKAVATFDVIPDQTFPLTFKEVSTRVDAQAQTIAATYYLSPDNIDYTFLPGMTVTVDVTYTSDDPRFQASFAVPPNAVLTENDGSNYVWLLDNTDRDGVYKTKKAKVTVGEFVPAGVLVTSGIKAGDKIAATAAPYLTEGETVTGLEWGGKE